MEPQRRWLQLSLRELLLLMLVLSLIVLHLQGLWRRTSGPSPFFEAFDPFELCAQVGQQLDLTVARGGGGELGDDADCVQSFELHCNSKADPERVVAALREHAVKMLVDLQGSVLESDPDSSTSRQTAFAVRYRYRDRRGAFVLHSLRGDSGKMALAITLHEARVAR